VAVCAAATVLGCIATTIAGGAFSVNSLCVVQRFFFCFQSSVAIKYRVRVLVHVGSSYVCVHCSVRVARRRTSLIIVCIVSGKI